jgi:hypothetical protein
LIDGQLRVPRAGNQQVVCGLEFLWAECECPHGLLGLALVDDHELNPCLVLDEDGAIDEADGEDLAIGRPIAAATLSRGLLLVYIRLVGLPQTEVDGRATGQILQNRVE